MLLLNFLEVHAPFNIVFQSDECDFPVL